MIIAQVHTIADSTRAFANFLKHCKESRGLGITRDLVSVRIINEELAKYGAEYDTIHCDVVFAEEKNYTYWLLKWS